VLARAFAHANQPLVVLKDATGGSAVPATPTTYGRSEYRHIEHNQDGGRGKGGFSAATAKSERRTSPGNPN